MNFGKKKKSELPGLLLYSFKSLLTRTLTLESTFVIILIVLEKISIFQTYYKCLFSIFQSRSIVDANQEALVRYSQWKVPISWKLFYGSKFDQTLFH